MSLSISRLREGDDESLHHIIRLIGEHNPNLLAYHYPYYRDLLISEGLGEGCFFLLEDDDKIVGLLPGMIKTGKYGSMFSSMPFFGANGGILLEDGLDNSQVIPEALKLLHAYLTANYDMLGVSIYTPFYNEDLAPYRLLDIEHLWVDKFTQLSDLNDDWPKKVRYDIRRAAREGVKVITETDAAMQDKFFEIYVQNCQDYSIPQKSRALVDKLFELHKSNPNVMVHLAEYEGEIISGLITLRSFQTVSYYLPCNLPEFRSLQAGTLLIDEAANEAKQAGARFWNWESSPSRDSGVYQFKKRWGSEEQPFGILIIPGKSIDEIKQIGRQQLQEHYPYYFVIPFDKI
ncbi:GNAT family N-acetyltransferase [Calditrichota bacterium]